MKEEFAVKTSLILNHERTRQEAADEYLSKAARAGGVQHDAVCSSMDIARCKGLLDQSTTDEQIDNYACRVGTLGHSTDKLPFEGGPQVLGGPDA